MTRKSEEDYVHSLQVESSYGERKKEKGLIVTGTKVNQELKSDMLSTCDSSMFLKIVNYEPILLLWLCFIMKVQTVLFFHLPVLLFADINLMN